MSNEIVIDMFEESPCRRHEFKGEPWWEARDVCAILDIANVSDACNTLDEDEKNTVVTNDGIRGNPTTLIINESGLYSLILRSRKPEAKRFKKWITSVVIPSIRKTGNYSIAKTPPTPGEMIRAMGDAMIAVEQEQAKLKAIASEHEQRLQQVEQQATTTDTKVTVIVEHRGRLLGIPGLADLGWKVPQNMQGQIGKELCDIARTRGDEPRSVHHKTPNGKFNCATYNPDVLKEWVKLNENRLDRQDWKVQPTQVRRGGI